MLEIRLFGPGDARYLGQPLDCFPNQQAHLLLCYIILNRNHPLPRERLAAVFWGDYPTHASRKHLSKALWRLRHGLELAGASADEYLCVNKDSIAFVSSSRYWLDIEVFEARITPFQNLLGQTLTPEQATELAQAIELYAGDLLEGVYEDWCLYDRERLNLLYIDALSKLMAFHVVNGTYECGLAYGERLLLHDNTYERAHRQMMQLYWLAGNRGAALAQYKYCVQILRDELGLAPVQETRCLYEQMVHNQFRLVNPEHAAASATIAPSSSFQQIAEQALQKLTHLQTITAESGAELQHLKRLISAALPPARRP